MRVFSFHAPRSLHPAALRSCRPSNALALVVPGGGAPPSKPEGPTRAPQGTRRPLPDI